MKKIRNENNYFNFVLQKDDILMPNRVNDGHVYAHSLLAS